jgi:hypothetical protein
MALCFAKRGRDVMKLQKPAHSAPCNGCGACCLDGPCQLSEAVFHCFTGPCQALEDVGDRYACGLVRSPASYAPVQAAIRGRQKLSEAASLIIGAGVGCNARYHHEPSNRIVWQWSTDEAINQAHEVWGLPGDANERRLMAIRESLQ